MLTEQERERLTWALANYGCIHNGAEDESAITGCSDCQAISERGIWPAVEAIVAAREATWRAPIEAVLHDLSAWDLVDLAVPECVEVPEDYELAMNDAGRLLAAALGRPVSGSGVES